MLGLTATKQNTRIHENKFLFNHTRETEEKDHDVLTDGV